MKHDETSERIVHELLRPPGVLYLREIRRILEQDPEYLQFHSASVSVRVNTILSKAGLKATVTDGTVASILREAVIRLRSVER